jgi:hypothetical protein
MPAVLAELLCTLLLATGKSTEKSFLKGLCSDCKVEEEGLDIRCCCGYSSGEQERLNFSQV